MAFCAKCGATLSSDGPGFCAACGAPVAVSGPAAVPSPVPPPTTPPPAMSYVTALPPQRSGNTVLKVVLIVIAVVVGLGVLGGATAAYLGYRAVHNGAFSVGSTGVSTAELGIDPYPNGTAVEHGTVRMKIAGQQMVTAAYSTSDAPDAVVSYFKGKLGDSAIVNQTGQGTTLQTPRSGSNDHLIITVTPDPQSGTKIVIIHSSGS